VWHIIPAVATTTAMVCGFISITLDKTHCVTKTDLEVSLNGVTKLMFLRFTFSEMSPSKALPLGGPDRSFHPVWKEGEVSGDEALDDVIHEAKHENLMKGHYLHGNDSRLSSDSSSRDDERRKKKPIDPPQMR
jgi:hypothetical protein